MRTRIIFFLCLGIIFIGPEDVVSSSRISGPPELTILNADAIVLGRVLDQRCVRDERSISYKKEIVCTFTAINVLECISGKISDKEIEVRTLGGTVDSRKSFVTGEINFHIDDEVVVYIKKRPHSDGTWYWVPVKGGVFVFEDGVIYPTEVLREPQHGRASIFWKLSEYIRDNYSLVEDSVMSSLVLAEAINSKIEKEREEEVYYRSITLEVIDLLKGETTDPIIELRIPVRKADFWKEKSPLIKKFEDGTMVIADLMMNEKDFYQVRNPDFVLKATPFFHNRLYTPMSLKRFKRFVHTTIQQYRDKERLVREADLIVLGRTLGKDYYDASQDVASGLYLYMEILNTLKGESDAPTLHIILQNEDNSKYDFISDSRPLLILNESYVVHLINGERNRYKLLDSDIGGLRFYRGCVCPYPQTLDSAPLVFPMSIGNYEKFIEQILSK